MRIKRLSSILLLSSVSFLLAFAILEFAVRQRYPRPQPLVIPHPILHHTHLPNSTYFEQQPLDEFSPVLVHFNELGLREERQISPQKRDKEFRILLLGDSFVEARQVPYEKTLAQVLEKQLNAESKRTGPPVLFTVINAGVSAYSPSLEYLYLLHEGLALRPDLVVLYFFFNDVTDDYGYRATMQRDDSGLPLAVSPQMSSHNSLWRLARRSRLVELSPMLFPVALRRLGQPFGLGELSAGNSEWLSSPYAFVGKESLTVNALAIFKKEYDPVEMEAWRDTRRYLAGLQGVLKQRGIPLVLAVIPAPPQVGSNQWRVGKVKWGMRYDEVITSTRMQDILSEHARQQGIHFLDLLPAFRAEADAKLYYDYDGHWSEAGNRLAAQRTLIFLQAQELASQPAWKTAHSQ